MQEVFSPRAGAWCGPSLWGAHFVGVISQAFGLVATDALVKAGNIGAPLCRRAGSPGALPLIKLHLHFSMILWHENKRQTHLRKHGIDLAALTTRT
ncbi:hypothetical protein [Curvibacter gracilis]|uniref:hypothetical protein n=1 Tax=Curvibacter gracilis TaxID=230310 RepID=UPI0012F86213|nr:hypothetical protein [Curvibacter gracilis]